MMNRREELNVEMMEQVNGGVYIHNHCDGELEHTFELFSSVECNKCHEKHYWLWQFDYMDCTVVVK